MQARRIAFVLPSLNGGGAERAAVQVLNALDDCRWDRSMFLFRREGPYLADVSPAIHLASASDASRAGRWAAVRRFVRDWQPEIVVSFLSFVSVLTAVRAARTGARVVFNQQTPMSAFLEDHDYEWRHPWHRRVLSIATRVGYARADAIVATSSGVADDLVSAFGVRRAHVRVIHNPVDIAAIRRAAAEPLEPAIADRWRQPVLVAAGRLADAKNYPLMIEALARLRARVPATLCILGQGEREASLRDQVARLGLEEAVLFSGFQANPWKFIARADAFVLTSRYEGFGNVLVEAMACGVPVVATASAGTRDIVGDGAGGVLVESHDVDAVAAALERLLTDRAHRDRLAAGARASVPRFDLPAVAGQYDAAFEGLLA
jgi:glycosyltransferase involved in cell wall biosynthesis